jgi:predicted Zn finger-like uncharacterized protein
MNVSLIRVACSNCGASFRVDPDAIPEGGATATCKKCGRKFYIPKPPSKSGLKTAPVPDPDAPPQAPRPSLYTCPKCGHRQTQAFNCYACGAVITPRPPGPPASQPPAPGPPASKAASPQTAPDMNVLLVQEMGDIVIRTRLLAGRWIQPYSKLRIIIDGMDYTRDWGVHAFRALKGDCEVAVDYRFFLRSFGKSAITVQVSENEKSYLTYDVPEPFSKAPGRLAKASLPEGALWQVSLGAQRAFGSVNAAQKKVILSLLFLGPLGLFPLWKSDAFSRNVKIAVTAGMVLFTLLIVSKL